jgi:hypothetical protein
MLRLEWLTANRKLFIWASDKHSTIYHTHNSEIISEKKYHTLISDIQQCTYCQLLSNNYLAKHSATAEGYITNCTTYIFITLVYLCWGNAHSYIFKRSWEVDSPTSVRTDEFTLPWSGKLCPILAMEKEHRRKRKKRERMKKGEEI